MASLAEFDALTTPTPAIAPREIVIAAATALMPKLSAVTGHQLDTNISSPRYGLSVLANTDTNYLDLSSMKGVHWIARYAVLMNDLVYARQFLLSAEAMMSYRNQLTPDLIGPGPGGLWITSPVELPDGAFPAESGGRSKKNYSLHHKTIAMDRVAQGLEVIKSSSLYSEPDIATRVDALVLLVEEFADFMLTFDDHADEFIDSAGAGNQTISIVTFLQSVGLLTGNSVYTDKARAIVEWVRDDNIPPPLAALIVDGTTNLAAGPAPGPCYMSEKRSADGYGFDGSYGSLSLELMCFYYLMLPAGAWKTEVLTIVQGMLDYLLLTIDTNPVSPAYGEVWDEEVQGAPHTWTRVHETVPIVRIPNSTDYNYCSFAFHIRIGAYVTGTNEEMSDAIMGIGQRFGHPAKDPDDPDTDPIDDPVTSHGGLTPTLKRQLLLTSGGRKFDVSPAISEKTTWNLDKDGPCTFPAGTYTITPKSSFSGVVELWGPGGGSGGVAVTTVVNGVAGAATTFTTEGATMSAGGGDRTTSKTSNSTGNLGVGGTATGGDVNTSGSSGTNGTTGTTSTAGSGGNGATPGGGTGATGASAGAGVTTAGSQGTGVGAGASGAVHGNATSASRRAAGGSGGGAYCKRTFTKGILPAGVARTLVVSAGGAAGTGDLANGAAGRDGQAIFT